MASDDDAPLEQTNKVPETLETVEVAETETTVKKRKRMAETPFKKLIGAEGAGVLHFFC